MTDRTKFIAITVLACVLLVVAGGVYLQNGLGVGVQMILHAALLVGGLGAYHFWRDRSRRAQ